MATKKPRRKATHAEEHVEAQHAVVEKVVTADALPNNLIVSAPVDDIIVHISKSTVVALDDDCCGKTECKPECKVECKEECKEACKQAACACKQSCDCKAGCKCQQSACECKLAGCACKHAECKCVPAAPLDYSTLFASVGTQRVAQVATDSLIDRHYKPRVVKSLSEGGQDLIDLVCEGISMVVYKKFKKDFVPSPDFIRKQLPAEYNLKDVVTFINANSICTVKELGSGHAPSLYHKEQAKKHGVKVAGFYVNRIDQLKVCVQKHFPVVLTDSKKLHYWYEPATVYAEPGVALCVSITGGF
jgi:hypothetical protein